MMYFKLLHCFTVTLVSVSTIWILPIWSFLKLTGLILTNLKKSWLFYFLMGVNLNTLEFCLFSYSYKLRQYTILQK